MIISFNKINVIETNQLMRLENTKHYLLLFLLFFSTTKQIF